MKIAQKNKICKQCNKEFFGRDNKIYCSNKCKRKKVIPIEINSNPKELLYRMDSEEIDTTYSSLWLYRKAKMILPFKDDINENNSYYSEFNPLISQNITNFWSKEGNIIIDPFAGRTRGIVSGLTNRKYYGFEISKEVYDSVINVIESGKNKFKDEFKPIIYNDDSINLNKYNLPLADLIFSCPPYWDLEKYPSTPGQLSDIKEYHIFLKKLKDILKKSIDNLKYNGYVCLVVGDFRKNGRIIDLTTDVINMMNTIDNIVLWDKIVLQNVNFGHASKRFGSIKHKKITAKVTEYLLVFKKENGKNKT
jgi:hypothetical protein